MVTSRTHIGLKRSENQDFMGSSETPYGQLIVVCDGMGGHRGGRHASETAVRVFMNAVAHANAASARQALTEAAALANGTVYAESQADTELSGMGTTLVAAVINKKNATIINIGDSRAYRFGSGSLRRITYDHSLVGNLVEQGKISEDEAQTHPRRNVITRAIGISEHVEPDLFEIPIDDNDVLLLSSDGLHGLVSDVAIESILQSTNDADAAADRLVEAALTAGGNDNVTVMLSGGSNQRTSLSGATLDGVPAKRSLTQRLLVVALVVGVIGVMVWMLAGDSFKQSSPQMPDSTSQKAVYQNLIAPNVPMILVIDSLGYHMQHDSTAASGATNDSTKRSDTNTQRR